MNEILSFVDQNGVTSIYIAIWIFVGSLAVFKILVDR